MGLIHNHIIPKQGKEREDIALSRHDMISETPQQTSTVTK